jgi:hypothetical protein
MSVMHTRQQLFSDMRAGLIAAMGIEATFK